jgi:hypothetical protein
MQLIKPRDPPRNINAHKQNSMSHPSRSAPATRPSAVAVLDLVTGELPTLETAPWLPHCDPEELVRILWQVGFLQAQLAEDAGLGREAAQAFVGPHQMQQVNLAPIQRFRVHPMFHAYLGKVETS